VSLAMALQATLKEPQMATYGSWIELRNDIEDELHSIERALRNDIDQIGTSAEAIYTSAERLKELVPELKQIAKALEDLEWKRAEESLPK